MIRRKQVRDLLGRRRFLAEVEVRRRTSAPSVAAGLAWTPTGGEILFVEATAFPGKGGLKITGQVGDVMRESAEAALSYVKSNARKWGSSLPDDWFREHDRPCMPARRSRRTGRAQASPWPPRWSRS